jgi:hypothetical protein
MIDREDWESHPVEGWLSESTIADGPVLADIHKDGTNQTTGAERHCSPFSTRRRPRSI